LRVVRSVEECDPEREVGVALGGGSDPPVGCERGHTIIWDGERWVCGRPEAGVPLDSITSGHIVDGTITTADIGDGQVTTPDLADGAVTGAKIADGTVTNVDLANNSVNGAKIVDGSVTNADLANKLGQRREDRRRVRRDR